MGPEVGGFLASFISSGILRCHFRLPAYSLLLFLLAHETLGEAYADAGLGYLGKNGVAQAARDMPRSA
jgi:hypothetical protein